MWARLRCLMNLSSRTRHYPATVYLKHDVKSVFTGLVIQTLSHMVEGLAEQT
jgi:hypothetical protein